VTKIPTLTSVLDVLHFTNPTNSHPPLRGDNQEDGDTLWCGLLSGFADVLWCGLHHSSGIHRMKAWEGTSCIVPPKALTIITGIPREFRDSRCMTLAMIR
jgi:hypothetical protein